MTPGPYGLRTPAVLIKGLQTFELTFNITNIEKFLEIKQICLVSHKQMTLLIKIVAFCALWFVGMYVNDYIRNKMRS